MIYYSYEAHLINKVNDMAETNHAGDTGICFPASARLKAN